VRRFLPGLRARAVDRPFLGSGPAAMMGWWCICSPAPFLLMSAPSVARASFLLPSAGSRHSVSSVIAGWFRTRFGSPTDPQRLGWRSIAAGQHTLIAAPTGRQNLAAFLWCLDRLSAKECRASCPAARRWCTSRRSKRCRTTFTAIWKCRWPRFVPRPSKPAFGPANSRGRADRRHAHRRAASHAAPSAHILVTTPSRCTCCH